MISQMHARWMHRVHRANHSAHFPVILYTMCHISPVRTEGNSQLSAQTQRGGQLSTNGEHDDAAANNQLLLPTAVCCLSDCQRPSTIYQPKSNCHRLRAANGQHQTTRAVATVVQVAFSKPTSGKTNIHSVSLWWCALRQTRRTDHRAQTCLHFERSVCYHSVISTTTH